MRSEWVGYPLLHSGDDITTELCVPIEDQKALRLLVPLPGLMQLHPDPKRNGIARDIVMDDATAIIFVLCEQSGR